MKVTLLLKNIGFVWVKRTSSERVEMAYWTGEKFQSPESVGDHEGLSVEYYDDVTHFLEMQEPDISEMVHLVLDS